jgi:hypothetical protein
MQWVYHTTSSTTRPGIMDCSLRSEDPATIERRKCFNNPETLHQPPISPNMLLWPLWVPHAPQGKHIPVAAS